MVTCNICKQNKEVEEMQSPFRYVCKNCWENVRIRIKNKKYVGEEEVDKELLY